MSILQKWRNKFHWASIGIAKGIRGQSSFVVHVPMACLVTGFAYGLGCSGSEWAILLLCIGCVLSAELMNSSIELLAKGLCREKNTDVGDALDVASGAVFVMSIASALVGLIILGRKLLALVLDVYAG